MTIYWKYIATIVVFMKNLNFRNCKILIRMVYKILMYTDELEFHEKIRFLNFKHWNCPLGIYYSDSIQIIPSTAFFFVCKREHNCLQGYRNIDKCYLGNRNANLYYLENFECYNTTDSSAVFFWILMFVLFICLCHFLQIIFIAVDVFWSNFNEDSELQGIPWMADLRER